MLLQTVNNHPVHILNEVGNFSPSSLVPFCYFGEEFIGARIQEFEIPVCNIFKSRIYWHKNSGIWNTSVQYFQTKNLLGPTLLWNKPPGPKRQSENREAAWKGINSCPWLQRGKTILQRHETKWVTNDECIVSSQ